MDKRTDMRPLYMFTHMFTHTHTHVLVERKACDTAQTLNVTIHPNLAMFDRSHGAAGLLGLWELR